jgi:hypothetical protein
MTSRAERAWRSFAIAMMGFAAFGGAIGAVGKVVAYHALATRGVQTTAIVESAWRVKSGWDCSVAFSDIDAMRRIETVSGCGAVRSGQAISVTYDRSDPSTVDPTGSVTSPNMLGLAAVLAVISVLLSFCTWVLWRKPRWNARPGRARVR